MTHESRVVVLGLPRFGKTRLVRDYLTADAERVVFHDVTGHDYFAPGRLPLSVGELEARQYLLNSQYMRIVVRCADQSDPLVIKSEVERLNVMVRRATNLVFVLDEVGDHHRKTDKLLNGLFANGSHDGIATILASQNTTDIPLGARTKASDVYCFGQHHPKELEHLLNCYGDRYAAAAAVAIKGKPPIHWRENDRAAWWSAGARKKFRIQTEESEQKDG